MQAYGSSNAAAAYMQPSAGFYNAHAANAAAAQYYPATATDYLLSQSGMQRKSRVVPLNNY